MLLFLGAGCLFVAYIVPNQHDYGAYVLQWEAIMSGKDPWIGTKNAYGITYNLFAPLAWMYVKLPKLVFVLSYLLAVRSIVNYCKQINFRSPLLIFYVLMLNPIVWFFVAVYGSNDAFLAAITILGILLLIKNQPRLSGFSLAIGSNFKFSSLFIVPFLVFDKRKINWKLTISFVLFSLLIVGIGFAFWGNSIFEPFAFGTSRESKMFSVFRFIRGDLQPLGVLGIQNADAYSTYIMLSIWLLSFFTFLIFRLDKFVMMLFAFSNVLLFYKIGHHQFYIFLFLLSVLTYVIHADKLNKNKALLWCAALFWSWIFLFTFIYGANRFRGEAEYIREWIGAPTFLFHFGFNLLLLIQAFKIRPSQGNSEPEGPKDIIDDPVD